MLIKATDKRPFPANPILYLTNAIVFCGMGLRTGNPMYFMLWILNLVGFSMCYKKYRRELEAYRLGRMILTEVFKEERGKEEEES